MCLILSRKDGTVLADGFNSEVCTRSANPRDGFSIHAEEQALQKFAQVLGRGKNRRLRGGVDVVSLRVSRAMVVGMSRPCLRCASKLSAYGLVRRVFWWEASSNGVGMVRVERAEELRGVAEHSTGDFFVKRGRSKNYTPGGLIDERPNAKAAKNGHGGSESVGGKDKEGGKGKGRKR